MKTLHIAIMIVFVITASAAAPLRPHEISCRLANSGRRHRASSDPGRRRIHDKRFLPGASDLARALLHNEI